MARAMATPVSHVLDRMEKAIRPVLLGRLKAGQEQDGALVLRTAAGTDWVDMPKDRAAFRARIRQLSAQPGVQGVALVSSMWVAVRPVADPSGPAPSQDPNRRSLLFAVIVDRSSMQTRTFAWFYKLNHAVKPGAPGHTFDIEEAPPKGDALAFGPLVEDLMAEIAGGRVA